MSSLHQIEPKMQKEDHNINWRTTPIRDLLSQLGGNLVSQYCLFFFFQKSYLLVTLYICMWGLHILTQLKLLKRACD